MMQPARSVPCCTIVSICYHNKIRILPTISWLILSGKTVQWRMSREMYDCYILVLLGILTFSTLNWNANLNGMFYCILKKERWKGKVSAIHQIDLFQNVYFLIDCVLFPFLLIRSTYCILNYIIASWSPAWH